jgi:hypothetical protein
MIELISINIYVRDVSMSAISSPTTHSLSATNALGQSAHLLSSCDQRNPRGLSFFPSSISNMNSGDQFHETLSRLDLRNVKKYLKADADDKALQYLYRLSPKLLTDIRARVFYTAHLEPSYLGDASDLYIKANPRSEMLRNIVANQVGMIAPATPEVKNEESVEKRRGCIFLFFSRVSSLITGFVNWFASFFVSAKELKEELDQIENSCLVDLIDLKTMIQSPYHNNHFILRCISVLFSEHEDLKEKLCFYVYEEAKKENLNISSPSFGFDTINEDPRGKFFISALNRMIDEESEIVKMRLLDK